MSTNASNGACRECVRRSWLLGKLSVRLDYRSRDTNRLLELLALDDMQLIEAIAGRWRTELRERWERFEVAWLDEPGDRDETGEPNLGGLEMHGTAPGVETVCRHSPGYPRMLGADEGAPSMLYVVGGHERLTELTSEPAVAIVGSEMPTDYGMEMAASLARGLAACGVTVVSGLANGIAAAAHAGALEAAGRTVTVMAGGVDMVAPVSRRELYERVTASGCAVAEPPCGYPQRRWCGPARARTVAGLAVLTIVVEADESNPELLSARVARRLHRTVAAVPGRVSSPVSRGTHALLREGAALIREPADALDLLYGVGAPRSGALHLNPSHERPPAAPGHARLEPRLQTMLERVGAGRDTPGKLTSEGEDPGETLLALAELELMGLLGRGDGGRYVPRVSLARR